jgi:hypothetical protein
VVVDYHGKYAKDLYGNSNSIAKQRNKQIAIIEWIMEFGNSLFETHLGLEVMPHLSIAISTKTRIVGLKTTI